MPTTARLNWPASSQASFIWATMAISVIPATPFRCRLPSRSAPARKPATPSASRAFYYPGDVRGGWICNGFAAARGASGAARRLRNGERFSQSDPSATTDVSPPLRTLRSGPQLQDSGRMRLHDRMFPDRAWQLPAHAAATATVQSVRHAKEAAPHELLSAPSRRYCLALLEGPGRTSAGHAELQHARGVQVRPNTFRGSLGFLLRPVSRLLEKSDHA